MNDLEQYYDNNRIIEQKVVGFETPEEPDSGSSSDLIKGVLRHWPTVFVTFVLMCAVGIPAIWHLIEPQYRATASIRIAPIIPNILFSDKDSESVMPMYDNFKSDQAILIMRDQSILQRVADDLADDGLEFFKNKSLLPEKLIGLIDILPRSVSRKVIAVMSPDKPVEPAEALKRAISDEIITASPVRRSEMLNIMVVSNDSQEAVKIATAFRTAYMAIERLKTSQGDQTLGFLENERTVFAAKLQQQRDDLRKLAEEFGTTELDPFQEMMLQRVAVLQELATKIDADKLLLDIKIKLLKETDDKSILQKDLLERRHTFIQNDLLVQMLTSRIAELEEELISLGQILSSENPQLKQKADLLKTFKTNLEEHRKKVEQTFDESIIKELSENREAVLADAELEMKGLEAQKKILQDKIDEQDLDTIKLGRKQLDITAQQEQLALTKEVYETIQRRIQQLEMERKRPARITVPYATTVLPVPGKRMKYTMALIFGSLACGMMLAFLRDKADLCLHTPEDVSKRVGLPIIGTTTSSRYIKPPLLPEQIAGDFQTIRTNLRLINSGRTPRRLIVTSPRMREGKTTFSVNLATSMSRSGKKVLLIDGDLRRPDVARMMNIPEGSIGGLQNVLLGEEFDNAVYTIPSTGLDVLVANSLSRANGYELLASPGTRQCIEMLSRHYDQVIIDTPPVLAFPDALIWAKLGDAVILVSYAGHTISTDLKEANERLMRINVKVLGTVLSNVRHEHSYYRYDHKYYAQDAKSSRILRRAKRKSLLPPRSIEDNPDNSITLE